MRELEIRVSYNVILVHFVDSLSKWDQYVEDYTFDYFQREFDMTELDSTNLLDYVKMRKLLGWDNETELFNWAYSDFPPGTKFDELLPIIRYFEGRKDKNKNSLKESLADVTSQLIQNDYLKINDVFSKKWLNYINQCSELFESEGANNVMPCYLLYSVDENQTVGGANGEGISLELTLKNITEKKFLSDVVLHEFIHKQVSPHRYFLKHMALLRDNPEFEALNLGYPDRFTSYIEEVIVYALVDIIIKSRRTPAEMVALQIDRKRTDMAILWKGVDDIMAILRGYFIGEVDISSTRKSLINYFVKKAS